MGFKKGHKYLGGRPPKGTIPWNKGTKGIMKQNSGSFKKVNTHQKILNLKKDFPPGTKVKNVRV